MRATRSLQRWSRSAVGGVALLILAGCHKQHPEGSEPLAKRQADGSLALDERALTYVRIEAAQPVVESRSRTLAARISFDERNMSRIGPPVQGRVSAVNVVTGDKVQKGAVLLTIDAPDIASAQAQVAQARNARMLAEQAFARAQRLSEEGAGSQAEMERSHSALEQARSEEQRAVATLNAIGGAHGAAGYQLRAPLSGSVVERNVAVGSQVSTGQDQPLFVISDLTTVWVLGDVYEEDLARVRVGDEATVRVLAYPDKRFAGKLTYLGETVDPLTRAARARIELENKAGELRPGMFAMVELKGLARGVADVPTSALIARRDEFYVFVKRADGAFVQKKVLRGEQHGAHTTVLDGVHPGDSLVTEGAVLLDVALNEAF